MVGLPGCCCWGDMTCCCCPWLTPNPGLNCCKTGGWFIRVMASAEAVEAGVASSMRFAWAGAPVIRLLAGVNCGTCSVVTEIFENVCLTGD